MARPTPLQLALAIAINRTKPKDTFVDGLKALLLLPLCATLILSDYIRDLREHIKAGRQSERRHQHLDRATFWQSECERTRALLEEEKNISFTLKRQNNAYQAQLSSQQSLPVGMAASVPSKRKAALGFGPPFKKLQIHSSVPASYDLDYGALSKGPSGSLIFFVSSHLLPILFHISPSLPVFFPSSPFLPVFFYSSPYLPVFFSSSPSVPIFIPSSPSQKTSIEQPLITLPGIKALRNLHELHTILKGQMFGAEPRRLTYHLNETADAMSVIVADLVSRPASKVTEASRIREICSTITAITRAFMTLLHGMNKLSDLSPDNHLVGNFVYHCAGLFDSILTTLEEAAVNEARLQPPNKSSTKISSKKPHRVHDQPVSRGHSVNETLMSSLTNLILVLIDNLQSDQQESHVQLLEALLYHLLTRLGEICHFYTFSTPSNHCIESEIRASPPLLNSEAELPHSDPTQSLERTAMAIEAPFMLAILKRAMSVLPLAMRRNMPEGLAGKYYLTPNALNKLQRTLVDCIFGPGARGGGDGKYASEDVLKRPELRESVDFSAMLTRGVEQREGMDKEEAQEAWFERELWALLGWEILGRDEDL